MDWKFEVYKPVEKKERRPYSQKENVRMFVDWKLIEPEHIIIDGIEIKLPEREEANARR